jgi:lactam utilization protein B
LQKIIPVVTKIDALEGDTQLGAVRFIKTGIGAVLENCKVIGAIYLHARKNGYVVNIMWMKVNMMQSVLTLSAIVYRRL